MAEPKNDIAWEKLFDKYRITAGVQNKGYFEITANQIKEFREPRLMTKFDHRSQLPAIFKLHQYSILPLTRGSYVIAPVITFHPFSNSNVEIAKTDFPGFLESMDFRNITSEATAINCVFVSEILNDFLEEEKLYPTVSGRMSSSKFGFTIDTLSGQLPLKVENSQIEIDGGFEGDKSLTILEAKNYLSDDFLVRQLYYPYRLWNSKINKPVRTVFLTYSNGIFHLREFGFQNTNHYNSIGLIREKKYIIRDGPITVENIQNLLSKSRAVPEPVDIPFPQADSFERVINLCELLLEKNVLTKEEITSNYDFDVRQTNYYTDAARYLGLVEKGKENNGVIFTLSNEGTKLFKLSIVDRQLAFVKLILSHKVFKKGLQIYLEEGQSPDKDTIVSIMKDCNLNAVEANSTYYRRASTILSWLDWIVGLIEE